MSSEVETVQQGGTKAHVSDDTSSTCSSSKKRSQTRGQKSSHNKETTTKPPLKQQQQQPMAINNLSLPQLKNQDQTSRGKTQKETSPFHDETLSKERYVEIKKTCIHSLEKNLRSHQQAKYVCTVCHYYCNTLDQAIKHKNKQAHIVNFQVTSFYLNCLI